MKRISIFIAICCFTMSSVIIPLKLFGQSTINRDTILLAAHEIMNQTTYCGLVTIDSTGQPQVRTMNPFPANIEFITWFATSRSSRKVKEIENNPKVCVYFANHSSAEGYININGTAEVIDDKELLGFADFSEIYVYNVDNVNIELIT
jgi:pyridoxine/pyridoxamine 5'-phosphate oxidase